MNKDGIDNSYELVLILKSDTGEALGKVTKLIEDYAGHVTTKDAWGRKNFAYPVKKESSGYYFDWKITLGKDKIKEFKKNLDFDEEVLRYLLLNE